MIQYFGHHHQTFHPFWPRHSLHHESRCFYKPRISWHTQLLWQNLIGKMIEKVHLFRFSTYAIRNHQHWHPWWQARPIQRPREQSSCWTSSWLDKQLCSLGDRNQSHTKPSDSGLYILFHAVGEVNFCHNDASNEEFLLLIFVLKSICGEWFVLYLLLKQKMPYPPARIEKSTTPFWMNTYHDYYSSKEQVWKYKKVYALL